MAFFNESLLRKINSPRTYISCSSALIELTKGISASYNIFGISAICKAKSSIFCPTIPLPRVYAPTNLP